MESNISAFIKTAISGVAMTAAIGLVASSASALTLASSSGSWSNVVLDNGVTVNPPGRSTVEFLNSNSEIRWGRPESNAGKSGLKFAGVTNQTFNVGDLFAIGTLTHFNLPTSQRFANSADLGITLDFSTPDVDQTFSFNFAINETDNDPPPPCPVGNRPCADIISFPNAFSSNTFNIDGVDYTLQLLGFSDPVTGTPVTQFVSSEGGTNSATLFAKITTPPPKDVPEPATIGGLGLLGVYLMSRCRGQKGTENPVDSYNN